MNYPKRASLGASLLRKKGSAAAFGALAGALGALAACQPQVAEAPKVVEVPRVVEVPKPVQMPRCELPTFNEGRKFVAEAWGVPDSKFDVGEPLRLQLRVSSRSYVSVFHVSTSCKVTRLLHNQPVKAAEIVDFPLRGSGIEMIVKPPTGKEGFYIIATREKLTFLSPADILRQSGGIASLDLSPAQFYKRMTDARGRINPDDWSMKTLQTTVVGR